VTKTCKCGTTTDIKDMPMKMGGLLCPKCRVILFQPYVDEEYFVEFNRRKEEHEKKTAQSAN
jgi:hypothetical protein